MRIIEDRTLKPMHRCKGVGGRHAETGSRGSVCASLTVLPFHPPGSNSDLHPPHGLLGPQGIGQAGSGKVDTDEAAEVIDAIAKTVAEIPRGVTGSQPIGGRDSVVTTGNGTVEVCLGASCKRSPLWLRSTETTSA